MSSTPHHPAEWGAWVTEACEAVGVDPGAVDVRAVLDLTKVVAHEVDRPMAPVTAFVLGQALAQHPGLTLEEACTRLTERADRWEAS